MPKILIIAEKPSVAKDIAASLAGLAGTFKHINGAFESDAIVISNAIGHLVELDVPEASAKGAALPIIPLTFGLRAVDRTKDQYKLLRDLMLRRDITHIVNACDAGREGELIFRLIYQLSEARKPIERMWMQSMTPASIRDAFENRRPGSDFDTLADAARSRAEADWLVGINGSRALSRLTGASTSTGRVQTPTLTLVVDRYLAIRNFRPEDYFEVHGRFGIGSSTYIGKWQNPQAGDEPAERLKVISDARTIQAKCEGKNPSSVTDSTKPVSKSPPKLFSLTSLQREVNTKLGLSAQQTLSIAQSLYETHKVLSYPRTSSSHLPDDYAETVRSTIDLLAQGPYKSLCESILEQGWIEQVGKSVFDSTKVSDHFAIVPLSLSGKSFSREESAVFEMVVKRFLAVFHPAAEYLSTVRTTIVEGEVFRSTGTVLVSPGWLTVYGGVDDEEAGKEPALCAYSPGDDLVTKDILVQSKKTTPPKLYTEASLLLAMQTAGKSIDDEELSEALKDCGIGTPATRASIIEGLLSDRTASGPKEPFMVREKKHLVPTDKGIKLVETLRAIGVSALTTAATTGEWEMRLALMEKGTISRFQFMADMQAMTTDMVTKVMSAQPVGDALDVKCPACAAGSLSLGNRTVSCTCGFQMWRTIAQVQLTKAQVEKLISERRVGLSGFVSSKTGKTFAASLILNAEHKVEFAFDAPPIGQKLPYACPKCGGGLLASPKLVTCEKACGLKVWTTVAKKTLTKPQVQTLLVKGEVGPIDGFVSARTGNTFKAKLVLAADYQKVEFVF
ncbi:TopA Topoisomerase IA [Comamonadaceae bacterium]